ncbi:hypothetical protein [Marinicellulosiphila megalodicopiae]
MNLTLGDTKTLNLTLEQDDAGIYSVSGDIENTTIIEYNSVVIDDIFCQ